MEVKCNFLFEIPDEDFKVFEEDSRARANFIKMKYGSGDEKELLDICRAKSLVEMINRDFSPVTIKSVEIL